MKKTLLSLSLITVALIGKAQNCSELFFSEYVEGANNDKALEIYNPTANPITINGDYRIVRYNNGTSASVAESSTQACLVLNVPHTIQPHDVWVLVIDKRNPNGTGQEIPVSAGLQAVADTFVSPDYNVNYSMSHNGNDAISLQKNVGGTWTYCDVIGEIGFDPGANGWGNCAPFYDNTCQSYKLSFTYDHTMIRHSNVKVGNTANPSPFNAELQWDTLARNVNYTITPTHHQLGNHTCDCSSITGIAENFKHVSQVKVFPNPSIAGGFVKFVSADKKIVSIVLMNAFGQEVKAIKVNNPTIITEQSLNLPSGVYFSQLLFEDKTTTIEKLIIE